MFNNELFFFPANKNVQEVHKRQFMQHRLHYDLKLKHKEQTLKMIEIKVETFFVVKTLQQMEKP